MQDSSSISSNADNNGSEDERAGVVVGASGTLEQRSEVGTSRTTTAHQNLLVDFSGLSLRVNFQSTFVDDYESAPFKHMCTFLHWRDAAAVGSTNKTVRELYLQHSHIILKPLLEILDGLVGSNIHEWCGKAYVPRSRRECPCEERDGEDVLGIQLYYQPLSAWDPRYKNYDQLDGHRQCAAMIDFLTMVCENLRRHLRMNRESISDFSKLPDIIGRDLGHWRLESDDPRWRLISIRFPCRVTLALNLALIHLVIESLAKGDYDFCAAAACGI